MQCEYNFNFLGDVLNTGSLVAAVELFTEEEWNYWQYRQQAYSTHTHLLTIPIIWGWNEPPTPNNLDAFDVAAAQIRASVGWKMMQPLLSTIVAPLLILRPGVIVKMMLARLQPNSEITRHSDSRHIWNGTHRCHLPLNTTTDCLFTVDKETRHLAQGQWVEINNLKEHEVHNNGPEARVHLMCDVLRHGEPLPQISTVLQTTEWTVNR